MSTKSTSNSVAKCSFMSLLLSLGLTARIGLGAHLCRMGRRIELCRYIRFALGNARGQARIKILAEHFIWATIVRRLSFPNAALLF